MKKFKKIIFLACFVMLIAVMAIAVSAYDKTGNANVDLTKLPAGTTVNGETMSGTVSLPLYDLDGDALTYYLDGTNLVSIKTKKIAYVTSDGGKYLRLYKTGETDPAGNADKEVTLAKIVVLNFQDDTINALRDGVNNAGSRVQIKNSTSLQYIYFSDSTASITTSDLFNGCTNLKGVYFSENSKLTAFSNRAFANCTSLTEVVLPPNLVELSSAFYGCAGLKEIYIPAGVTKLWYSFFGCKSLEKVEFAEGSKLTVIDQYTFEECNKLASINIPNGVTKIGFRAFYNCTSLGNLTLPNSVEEIGSRAFRGCNFTEINLGASLQNFGIGDDGLAIFYHCYNLQKIVIPASLTISDNVTQAFNEFRKTGNTKPVKIFFTGNEKQANELLTKLKSAGGMPSAFKNNITIVDYNSDDYNNITDTGSYIIYNYNHCEAFYGGEHTFSENPVLAYSKGFDQAGTSTCTCTRDNKCGYSKTTIIDPIFAALGYSIKEGTTDAIYGGFTVDTTALANYNAYVGAGNELKYGIVIVNVGDASNISFTNGVIDSTNAIQVEIKDTTFTRFGFTLTGFTTDTLKALNIVISAYVIDGDNMSFVQKTESYGKNVTVNSVDASTLGAVKFTDVEAWTKPSSVA